MKSRIRIKRLRLRRESAEIEFLIVCYFHIVTFIKISLTLQ